MFNANQLLEIRDNLKKNFCEVPLCFENVAIQDSLGRVLSKDLFSPEKFPYDHRATMDGVAIAANDTSGASSSHPICVQNVGAIEMGKDSGIVLAKGQGARIPTGGILPKGADSVVMVEHTQITEEDTILIEKAVLPWENVNKMGSDVEKDALLYSKGHVIRPQDIGVMTALGILEVCVIKKPVVAVISTGNEIVDASKLLVSGQIRDINTSTLCASVVLDGAEALPFSPVQDEALKLREAMEEALKVADVVLVSGGSAKGVKDMTHRVIESIQNAKVLIRKETSGLEKKMMVANIGGKAVFGLPGHPLSAFLLYRTIISGFIRERSGKRQQEIKIEAFFSQRVTSKLGREEFILVRLEDSLKGKVAIPISFKPYSLVAMVKTEGMVYIPADKEWIEQNEKVEVLLYSV